MGGIVSLWQASRRFLLMVVVFDLLIAGIVVGLISMHGALSAAGISRGLWVGCVFAGLAWLLSTTAGGAFFGGITPGIFALKQDALSRVEPMSTEARFEMTWLTLAVIATLGAAAFALGAL